jgi:hypothetical protein
MANFPPVSSPLWEKWERLADQWPTVIGEEFADGGIDVFSPVVSNPIRQWRITYRGLTLAEAQILDDWYTANRGRGIAFNFTDRDTTVYGGVRCIEYTRGHGRLYAYAQFRELLFEDRP